MSFWANVERELEYKGISRKELAFRANIAYQGIGLGIERDSMPRADTALKISKILEVPLENLLDEENLKIRSESQISEDSIKNRCVGLYLKNEKTIKNLEKLPPPVKNSIEEMISRVCDSIQENEK